MVPSLQPQADTVHFYEITGAGISGSMDFEKLDSKGLHEYVEQ